MAYRMGRLCEERDKYEQRGVVRPMLTRVVGGVLAFSVALGLAKSQAAGAQSWNLGVQVGGAAAQDDELSAAGGFFVQVRLTSWLAWQAELLYERESLQALHRFCGITGDCLFQPLSLRAHALHVPLLLQAVPRGWFVLFGGPAAVLRIDCSGDLDSSSIGSCPGGPAAGVSGVLGVGLRLPIPHPGVWAELRIRRTLTPLAKLVTGDSGFERSYRSDAVLVLLRIPVWWP